MKLDDAALRAAYRDVTRRARQIDCPSSETLARAAAGELPSGERNELVSHLAVCSDCSEELQLARPLDEMGAADAGGRRTWRFVLPLAAAVLLAAGVAIVMRSPSRLREPDAVRGAQPSGERMVPSNGARLHGPPAALEWTNAPPAESFEIVVFDAESTEVWRSAPSAAPKVVLPAALRSSLKPGTPYYWRILAVRGVERSTSPLFRFEIAPTP
ncbi:MAG: hypothetical protein ACHQM4_00150 [Thermoanaerobaculia bacterium]